MKPSPVVFQQAVHGVGCEARETVFVGDSLRCDIGGASAVGLDTVWVDRAGVGPPPGGPSPTFVVRDLLELIRA